MRRAAALSLIAIGFMGCDQTSSKQGTSVTEPLLDDVVEGTPPSESSAEVPDLTARQRRALRALEAESGVRWTVGQDARRRTPSFLAPPRRHGPRVLATGASEAAATRATLAFIAEHREVLRMRAPHEELSAIDAARDDLGMTHVRMKQVERGVPVEGGELYVHYDEEGRLTSIQGRYVADLSRMDVTPSIAAHDAHRAAIADLVGGTRGADELEPMETPRLVVWTSGAPTLAWEARVRLRSGVGQWLVTVDARTGRVLERMDEVESLLGSGVGVKGDRKPLQYVAEGGALLLVDATRAAPIVTGDAQATTDFERVGVVASLDPNVWDAVGPARGSAVDAHVHVGMVYDWYAKTFGRRGFDDKDTQISNVVHWDSGLDNAFYLQKTMFFGDGKVDFFPTASSFDICAHEYVHGVTESTSALIYKDQSGALNESLSDIFAAIIEHAYMPDPVRNFQMGEGVMRDGGILRDLANPGGVKRAQPSHMKEFVVTQQDNGGVHINSGIPNKAAHLMIMGGTHPVSKIEVKNPLGFDKVAQVLYRANARYLIASSDFALAAQATMQAATDLKLSKQDLDTIDCAWKAVGVVQGACATPPAGAPPNGEVPKAGVNEGTDAAGAEAHDHEGGEGNDEPARTSRPRDVDGLVPAQRSSAGCTATGAPSSSGWQALIAVGLLLSGRVRRRRPRA